MIDLIFIITLSINAIFISLTVILGYTGDGISSLYAPIVMLFSLISIAFITIYELFNKNKKAKGSKMLYFFPLLFVFFYIIDSITTPYSNQAASLSQFLSSVSYATSGIYIATFSYRYSKIDSLLKSFNIIMIIITVAIALAIPETLFLNVVYFGTGTYQTLAYFSAFSFGINLYGILSKNKALKYKFQETTIYKSLSIVMLFIQITGVFISGGRGGAVLLFINTFVLFYILSRHNIKKVLMFILLFVPAIYIVFSYANPQLVSMIENRSERTFSYIGDEGLDLSETSGRDIVYSAAIDKVADNLLYGYGIFKQYDMMKKDFNAPYVHNIFIEILLQGGIILLMTFLYLLFKHFHKLKFYLKTYPERSLIIVVYLYAMVFLMFSGSYMSNTYFWFTLTFILLFNPKEDINNL